MFNSYDSLQCVLRIGAKHLFISLYTNTYCVSNVRNIHNFTLADGGAEEAVYEGGVFDFIIIAYLERCLSKK